MSFKQFHNVLPLLLFPYFCCLSSSPNHMSHSHTALHSSSNSKNPSFHLQGKPSPHKNTPHSLNFSNRSLVNCNRKPIPTTHCSDQAFFKTLHERVLWKKKFNLVSTYDGFWFYIKFCIHQFKHDCHIDGFDSVQDLCVRERKTLRIARKYLILFNKE